MRDTAPHAAELGFYLRGCLCARVGTQHLFVVVRRRSCVVSMGLLPRANGRGAVRAATWPGMNASAYAGRIPSSPRRTIRRLTRDPYGRLATRWGTEASGGAGNDVVDVGSALHPAAVRAPSLVSSYVARYRHLTWHLGRHRASVHVCGGAGVPVAVAGPLALQRLLCCLLWLCLPCRACIAAGCLCVTAGRAQLPMRSHWWLRSDAGYV